MKKLQRDIEGDENNIVKLRESEKRELEVSHSIILQSEPLMICTQEVYTGCIKKKFTVGKSLRMPKAFNAFNKIL